MSAQILCIGECMAELSGPDGARRLGFGGDTLNTAMTLAHVLGPGRVGYVTRLGDDPYSEAMTTAWDGAGIDCSLVERAPGETVGLYAIETDTAGERSFTYWREAAPARGLFTEGSVDARAAAIAVADAIYFSGITLAILPEAGRTRLLEAAARAKARGALVAVDPNHRPRLWQMTEAARWIEAAYRSANLVLTSEAEELALFGPGDPAARAMSWDVETVILKAGMGDVRAQKRAMAPISQSPAPVARVRDTTGAGDAFNAGVLAALLSQRDLQAAVAEGIALGRLAVQHAGAILSAEAIRRR